jgi:citronellyl-CoA synthetase
MGIRSFLGDLKILYKAATLKPPTPDSIGSIPVLVESNVQKYPNDTALICEGEEVTWTELNNRANRIAHKLAELGIEKGDCVSLFMQNRIEFIVNMLGIQKLGATVGMINTNLAKQQLTHCINLIESKKCIFGEELMDPLSEVRSDLKLADGNDYLFVRDPQMNESPPPNWAITLNSQDESIDHSNLAITQTVKMSDRALYIFTSGTTGLPKAAIVSNRRILPNGSLAAEALFRITHEDRMYNCLPLYHATGLIVGLTSAFSVGASSVIKRKLSISAFWDDIRKNNCTCFIYIGEFIRYLMSRPPHKDDAINPIRTIAGNGLRPDIWMAFKERFGIERIGELYGASEGNGSFANIFNKDCTVGMGVSPVKLVKYDVAADEIMRD